MPMPDPGNPDFPAPARAGRVEWNPFAADWEGLPLFTGAEGPGLPAGRPPAYTYQHVEAALAERENWVLRRQQGLPNNRRLFVLTCMDERVPIEAALGLEAGDAHICRNAGGVVTDDAIRSAMLSCNFFGSREIIVVMHTECGMMSHFFHAGPEILFRFLEFHLGPVDPAAIPIDPSLPELTLTGAPAITFTKWVRMFADVDAACTAQVDMLRRHPLIPPHVPIHGYVYEVESGHLRRPGLPLGRRVNTAREMWPGR